jgi:hypothetical protein
VVGVDPFRSAVQESFVVDRSDRYRLRHSIRERDAEARAGIHTHNFDDLVTRHDITATWPEDAAG